MDRLSYLRCLHRVVWLGHPLSNILHRMSGVHGTLRTTARRGWNKSLLFLLKWIDTDLHLGDKKASFYLRL